MNTLHIFDMGCRAAASALIVSFFACGGSELSQDLDEEAFAAALHPNTTHRSDGVDLRPGRRLQ